MGWHRLSLRMQLTLLYAIPFVLSGIALLTASVLSIQESSPAGTPPPVGEEGSARDITPLLTISAVGLVLMVLVSVLLGWLIAGWFLRPLRTITATAQDISANNLHRRLNLRGRDEFTALGNTLDDLFGRLEAAFTSQRHFVANAAHELRTPLTAERTLLQVALADPAADPVALRIACNEVLELGRSQERLIDALLTLASSEQGIERREAFDLAGITAEVVAARQPEASRRGIRIESKLDPAPAAGDPRLVESLVANLVDNALRHNTSPGQIWITTGAGPDGSALTVRNTGPVIAPDQVERLLQPFQRLGRQRTGRADGHGLGLAIVRAVANAHHAVLVAGAREGGGLEVKVSFTTPDDHGVSSVFDGVSTRATS